MQYKIYFFQFISTFILFLSLLLFFSLCLFSLPGCLEESLPEKIIEKEALIETFSIIDTWPANGTQGVPQRLPWVAMLVSVPEGSFFDPLQLDVVMTEEISMKRIVINVNEAQCSEIGWNDSSSTSGRNHVCIHIKFQETLSRSSKYVIQTSSKYSDSTTESNPSFELRFETAQSETSQPTELVSPTCAIDELTLEKACLLVDDQNAMVRIKAQGPIRAWLSSDELTSPLSQVSAQGEVSFLISSMPSNHDSSMQLRIVDMGFDEQSLEIPFQTTPPLPKLFITEVLVDPHGSDKNQEYVEIFNADESAISLQGFYLADSSEKDGDLIAENIVIPSQSFALIVASGFSMETWDERNGVLLPGTKLIHLPDTTVGSGGLNNAGEPLFLRDANMQRISSAPSLRPPDSGVCMRRISENGRTGRALDFEFKPEIPCTPGTE